MDLQSLIDAERVRCEVAARSKKHALELVSELLAKGDPPLSAPGVFDSLVQRERLGSTAIGASAAIPHGRLADVSETRVAVIRLSEPVDFDAVDGQPVSLIIGMVVPVDGSDEEHLELLSTIAALLRDAAFRESLDVAPGRQALVELLATAPAPTPDRGAES